MVAAFVLGTSEIIGRNLESDEAAPKRKVQFVRTGGDGGRDQPVQNPMDVVPQNAPPMLLPLSAEHGAPSYAQSARPFPPLNAQAVPELPWRVKEKAKAKAKGKEKAKEKEKRTRAMTAEAEQQKRRDAHQAKHFRGVLDDIKEKKAAKQRGEFGNRYIPLAGSDGEPEVVLD
ncbi:hypothetical protein BC629DRAFT_1499787 [Irpex lacteus]|nr:hypothetical protein BC629DRAFT_1499787 [Irpex lacteus]